MRRLDFGAVWGTAITPEGSSFVSLDELYRVSPHPVFLYGLVENVERPAQRLQHQQDQPYQVYTTGPLPPSRIVVQDSAPALLGAAPANVHGRNGTQRTRHGFFAKVRIEDYGSGRIRPHERTHPAARGDSASPDARRTRAHFFPTSRSSPTLAGAHGPRSSLPWGEVTDDEGTTHRLWRVTDAARDRGGGRRALAHADLLIADGHHRYETARVYAGEIGGEGEHRYVLMCLVSMSDSGLAVFPTHRLVGGLDDARRRPGLDEVMRSEFELTEVGPDGLVLPSSRNGELPSFGFLEAGTDRALETRALTSQEDPGPRTRRPLRHS